MTTDEALEQLEQALTNYMVALEEESGRDSTGLMIEGWVAQVTARSIAGVDNHSTANAWLCSEAQSAHVTVGLAHALAMNVDDWYRSGVPIIDDDE